MDDEEDQALRRRYAQMMEVPLDEVAPMPLDTIREQIEIMEEQEAAYAEVAALYGEDEDEDDDAA